MNTTINATQCKKTYITRRESGGKGRRHIRLSDKDRNGAAMDNQTNQYDNGGGYNNGGRGNTPGGNGGNGNGNQPPSGRTS